MFKIRYSKLTLYSTIALSTSIYAVNPNFHLKNKSADAIQIDIMQGSRSLAGGLQRVAKGSDFAYVIEDINKPTTLEIHYCPTAAFCKTNVPEKMVVTFKPGKTIYVKFDGKKVTPQKGSSGKTTSGYDLKDKNNVTTTDIKITPLQQI